VVPRRPASGPVGRTRAASNRGLLGVHDMVNRRTASGALLNPGRGHHRGLAPARLHQRLGVCESRGELPRAGSRPACCPTWWSCPSTRPRPAQVASPTSIIPSPGPATSRLADRGEQHKVVLQAVGHRRCPLRRRVVAAPRIGQRRSRKRSNQARLNGSDITAGQRPALCGRGGRA
jgi:hypothetical protein